jgi:hypothetical protein
LIWFVADEVGGEVGLADDEVVVCGRVEMRPQMPPEYEDR